MGKCRRVTEKGKSRSKVRGRCNAFSASDSHRCGGKKCIVISKKPQKYHDLEWFQIIIYYQQFPNRVISEMEPNQNIFTY